ncbi:MAG: hypothetical protein RR614_10885, partial [Eubacterium sp.]
MHFAKFKAIVGQKPVRIILSLVLPILVLLWKPLGINLLQSGILALLILTITWWCTGIVKNNIASAILLLGFCLFPGVPLKTVFAFPLGSTFWLIALTYLFSRGISNSKIAEKFLEPMLFRFADTPLKVMMFAAAMLMATMYIIPQPLARLIIIADIIYCYLHKTDAPKKTKEVLMFSVFVAYVFVNSMSMKAD